MPFLSPNQQRQSSEGTICHNFSGYSPIGLIGLVGLSDLVSGMSTLPVVGGILSVLLYVYTYCHCFTAVKWDKCTYS